MRDTDHDIEAAEGREISEIFVDDGEEHFRALEREAVHAALTEHEGVLALGGGAVLDPGTQELAARPARGLPQRRDGRRGEARRARASAARCCSATCGRGSRRSWTSAAPSTASVATVVVDTDGKTPEEVADEVAAAVEQLEESTR